MARTKLICALIGTNRSPGALRVNAMSVVHRTMYKAPFRATEVDDW